MQRLTNQELHLHIILLCIEGPVKFDDDGELFIPAHNEGGTLVLVCVVVFFVLRYTHVNAQYWETCSFCLKKEDLVSQTEANVWIF